MQIQNFRSTKDIDIVCDNLVAILGRNGSGKSTILNALDVFYNVAYQANEYDYFAKDTSLAISIQVTYANLRERERTEFAPYLSDNELIVRKTITSGGAKYFGTLLQLPEFAVFRKLGALAKRKALNELIGSGKYVDLHPTVTSEATADALMTSFEANHPDLLAAIPREQQFFGPRNIGGGKLDKYTKFVLVPAVRDAASEAEKKGVILQLIDVLVARSVNARPDVQKLNAEFEQRVKEVYSHENLTELRELAQLITSRLAQYAPGAQLDLTFEQVSPPKITLPNALASLVEDNFSAPIAYTGHGLQRALILALLQQLSLTDLAPPTSSLLPQSAALPEPESLVLPDLILGVEEPELFLHPSRSRFLARVFRELSKTPEDLAAPRTQVLYGTHSPYFVEISDFDRVRLARKILTPDYDVLQCAITAFSKAQAAAMLAQISDVPLDRVSGDSFVAHAVPVMSSIVNEGFFADVVLVVEGLTEVGIFWGLQTILRSGWDGFGIVIVPAEGKSKIDRPTVIFRGLQIPTYFVFDADAKHKGDAKKEPATAKLNERYMRLAGVPPQPFPPTIVNSHWAVFEDDVEDVIELAVGETAFIEARDSVAASFGYSKPSEAIKNPEVAARVVTQLYESGKRIPVLEEIVAKVTNLRAPIASISQPQSAPAAL
jgi:energy-coupling factor transporter ATP-binding protein EcfA2